MIKWGEPSLSPSACPERTSKKRNFRIHSYVFNVVVYLHKKTCGRDLLATFALRLNFLRAFRNRPVPREMNEENSTNRGSISGNFGKSGRKFRAFHCYIDMHMQHAHYIPR
ncbi:unnamed protein product [Onchocerca flexuosa]|uniref:Uncharacterized protein n=1 Tax=Onchocerca flexuosa TaxID=387005 RepID=A0A183I4X6_9BILA|nr:unnamed protein product [Onchocerca flexuosa]